MTQDIVAFNFKILLLSFNSKARIFMYIYIIFKLYIYLIYIFKNPFLSPSFWRYATRFT